MRDRDIRSALRHLVEAQHADEEGTRIVDELAICEGAARVDLAVVNGLLQGYEIKSEYDTLARLPAQLVAYGRTLDRMTIVVGPKYAERIAGHVPEWWGILVADDSEGAIRLTQARPARANPSVEPMAQAQLLWRDEVLEILADRELDHGIRSKSRRVLWSRLVTRLSPDVVGDLVRERLKSRPTWRAAESPA